MLGQKTGWVKKMSYIKNFSFKKFESLPEKISKSTNCAGGGGEYKTVTGNKSRESGEISESKEKR